MDFGSRAKRVKVTDHMIWPINNDLLIKVLCGLPPKDLIRCSCVCKSWFGLIYRYCVPQIMPSLPFLGLQMRIRINSRSQLVGLASIPRVEADVDAWTHIYKSCNPIVGPGLLEEIMEDFFQINKYLLDSCNGLMLFKHPCRCMYVLCNPNTKQFLFVGSATPAGDYRMYAALAVEPAWKLDKNRDFYKILAFTSDINVVKVFRSSKCFWVKRKVKYNRPIDNYTFTDGKRSYKGFVYFHGRLFTLHLSRLLLWYTIEDDNVDVVCDYVKLPKSRDHRSGIKEECIGLCGGRLQLSRNDKGGSLVQIWVFSVDTREWIFLHCVSLESLVTNPQLVHLSTMFPAVKSKFKVLAFDPISDDGVIIWTPNRIFCYYYKSGNLVSLQCPEILTGELKDPPREAFPFTPCLIPLLYKGGRRNYIIKVAKLPDGTSATRLSLTEERKLEQVSTSLCSLLL